MRTKTFFEICQKGTLREVRDALANGADVNDRGLIKYPNRDNYIHKWTSLMLAVYNNDEHLVSLLLEQPGIEVNAQDEYGRTALHGAAFNETNINVIKLLLNFPGIDIDVTDQSGQTPYEVAYVDRSKIFMEEYRKKRDAENDEDKKKMEVEIKKPKNTKSATNQETNKRKRETTDVSLKQKNMWKKLKTVQNSQKAAEGVVEEEERERGGAGADGGEDGGGVGQEVQGQEGGPLEGGADGKVGDC